MVSECAPIELRLVFISDSRNGSSSTVARVRFAATAGGYPPLALAARSGKDAGELVGDRPGVR